MGVHLLKSKICIPRQCLFMTQLWNTNLTVNLSIFDRFGWNLWQFSTFLMLNAHNTPQGHFRVTRPLKQIVLCSYLVRYTWRESTELQLSLTWSIHMNGSLCDTVNLGHFYHLRLGVQISKADLEGLHYQGNQAQRKLISTSKWLQLYFPQSQDFVR